MYSVFCVRVAGTIASCAAILATIACGPSPSQPAAVTDTGVARQSQSFGAASAIDEPAVVDKEAEAIPSDILEESSEDVPEAEDGDVEVIHQTDSSDHLFATATARTYSLSGTVTDKGNRSPIRGVRVSLPNGKYADTDSRGVFKLKTPGGTFKLKFKKAGYNPTSTKDFQVRSNTTVNMKLSQKLGSKPSLDKLTLSANALEEGASTTGTVFLTNAAPAGGSTIRLSSSPGGIATVPDIVTVLKGERSKSFTVLAVGAGTATIAGVYDGVRKTASLKVNGGPVKVEEPVARFVVSPSQCDVTAGGGKIVLDCSFDASGSSPDSSDIKSYVWTFPDGKTLVPGGPITGRPITLTCGDLGNDPRPGNTGLFNRDVILTITTASGRSSEPKTVLFNKKTFC